MHKRKQLKYIYAIRNRNLQQNKSNRSSELPLHTIGSLSDNFILLLGPQLISTNQEGAIIEQERSKFGQYLCSFDIKGSAKITPENVLISFPVTCTEQQDKVHLTEEDFKKFISQFKIIMNNDDSDESSYSRHSQSQQQISLDHKCRGRPKGSKNRRKESIQRSSEEEFFDDSNKKYQEKRGRGRPKGAKNIKKMNNNEDLANQFNIFQLFTNLFETKSIEEVNTKINRLKDKDDKLNLLVKKEDFEGEQTIKRCRGRPKGVKNKPKFHNEEEQSEQTLQVQSVPKRKMLKGLLFGKCCKKCNEKQQKKQFFEGKNINLEEIKNVFENFSVEDFSNMIIYAIKSGQEDLLKSVLARKQYIQNQFVISWDANSRLQPVTYTVRTRKEYISKSKREGIHPLIQDCYKYGQIWWMAIGVQRILENIPNNRNAIEIYNLLVENEPDLKREIKLNVATLVRCGNQILASYLIENIIKQEQNQTIYGYSKDHLECFSKKKSQLQFKKSMMLKQNYTANFCSPIHCATINSNIDLLTYILKHISEFNVGDSMNRKPIHYAAVLQTPKVLQLLIKFGADLKDIDKRKMTPLMLASQFGRTKNLKLILQKVRDPQYINFKGQEGLSALHYATINRHHECVLLLFEDTLVEKEIETKEGMNIFHLAAGSGQKELIKIFLERGYMPQPDNYRRTPLMIAIRNYQNDIFFSLFSNSSCYYKRDYSYNTLLHYAAAYGNMEIVKYLLEMGMNQTMNRKSFYPFEIAILKGHISCAKLLENWNLHFSHHLLNRILKNPRGTNEFYEIFQYLLQTRRYDLNYRNPNACGNTCLHFVCSISQNEYYSLRKRESTNIASNEYNEMQSKLISLLLKYGANPNIENDKGQKPINLCIQNQNLIGIKLLLEEINFDTHPLTKNNHYVYYLTNIACLGKRQMEFVYKKLIKVDQKILRAQLKKTDSHGFQFLIYLIKKFTETMQTNFKNQYQYYKKQLEVQSKSLKADELQKTAILKAFQDYLEHEQYLIKTVNFLVQMGADPRFVVSEPKMDEQYQNYKKWGIQHFLMKFPSLNLLKMFMKWIDTNFNLQNSEGRTPLHLFCLWNSEGCLFNSFHENDLPIINYPQMKNFEGKVCLQYLLENGLTCNVLDINRSTPLLYAALNGQLGFIKLLRTFGSTINNVNSLNQVPLIQIIKTKNKFTLDQIQSILTDEGVRADFKDLNERNCLHHLVSNAKNFDNSPAICKKLFEYGVNVNSLDKFGRSPIFYCFIKIDQDGNGDLNDKVQILQSLLSHEDIDLNLVDVYQKSQLHYACQKSYFFSIIYLLEKNINYDLRDSEGNTPLAICLKHKNLNQAAMLIKRGVSYGHVIQNGEKYSYFAYAMQKLSVGICFILIDHGYPYEKAIQQTPNHPFKKAIQKRYGK